MEEFSQFLNSFNLKDILPVVTGVITGLFAAQVANRKIEIENITQERAKWREIIRINSEAISKAALNKNLHELIILRSKFRVLLNPKDELDQGIINCISNIYNKLKKNDDCLTEEENFSQQVAALLKHDWERAKCEAKPWYVKVNYFFGLLARILVTVFIFELLVKFFECLVKIFPDSLGGVFNGVCHYNNLEELGKLPLEYIGFFIVLLWIIWVIWWVVDMMYTWICKKLDNCKRKNYLNENNNSEEETKKQ